MMTLSPVIKSPTAEVMRDLKKKVAGHFLIRMVFRHGRTVHSRSVNVTVTVNVTCIHLGGPGIIGRADSIGIGF